MLWNLLLMKFHTLHTPIVGFVANYAMTMLSALRVFWCILLKLDRGLIKGQLHIWFSKQTAVACLFAIVPVHTCFTGILPPASREVGVTVCPLSFQWLANYGRLPLEIPPLNYCYSHRTVSVDLPSLLIDALQELTTVYLIFKYSKPGLFI